MVGLALACGGAGEDGTGGESDSEDVPIPDMERCAPISIPTGPGPGAQQLERVATRNEIPGLAQQPTAHGRILGTVFAFDGRLHLGYGDYTDNTGPIAMTAWDPGQQAFVSLGTLPTEEVLWFRSGHGTLYSPAVDPDGHEESGGVYRLDCGQSSWQVMPPIEGAVHVYDVAVQGEAIYATTGSLNGRPALLLESHDHGEHWTEILRRESAPDRFSRFYFVGATEQLLFVSGREHPDPGEPLAWLRRERDRGSLEPLADPPDGALVPIVLRDAMVIAAFSSNPGRGSHQGTYRIEGQAFVPDQPWPAGDGLELVAWAPQLDADGGPERLLVLMRATDGTTGVYRTAALAGDATSWEHVAELEALPDGDQFVSMALLLGDLYLGTRAGSLHALRELDAPAP
ncbi:beta propeller repeat protein [Paraliomyxa miuraensis]|uniref:hypothetical protein n=1 Tax=Paraliomyxa miuraensis TaxID=376150 RepID=UPI0022508BF3|nr:hypothetical protein [Paraliomyxa miuraensis]MCX4247898.1 hypothetical protein [Paraliomyxa miuraensis]